jgi:ABC-type transport system substrate-binding protein
VKTGDIDLISDVLPEEIESLEADPNVKILKKPSLYNMMLTLRSDEGPFKDDINLRKAVAHAIDIKAICKEILGGYAVPIGSVVPVDAFGYNKNLKPYKYDPKLAKEYLKKSDYKGEEIAIQSSTGRYIKDIEINTAIEGWLKAIGIKAKLRLYDWPTWMNLFSEKKADPIMLLGWTARSGDGAENLFNTSHSDSPYSFYGENGIPGVDEEIDTAGTSFDPKIRKEAIEKAQKLLYDHVAFGFNYVPVKIYALQKNVKWTPRADEAMVISLETDK